MIKEKEIDFTSDNSYWLRKLDERYRMLYGGSSRRIGILNTLEGRTTYCEYHGTQCNFNIGNSRCSLTKADKMKECIYKKKEKAVCF